MVASLQAVQLASQALQEPLFKKNVELQFVQVGVELHYVQLASIVVHLMH